MAKNDMLTKFKQWLDEEGYRPDDARFCFVPNLVPGVRPLPDPQNVTPVVWDIWPKMHHVTYVPDGVFAGRPVTKGVSTLKAG